MAGRDDSRTLWFSPCLVSEQVVYDRLLPRLRSRIHRHTAERAEAAHGVQASEHPAKLAMQVDHGRYYGRSAPYRWHAAQNAIWRNAYHYAMRHLTRGLEVLHTLLASRENV